ncbi:hypothetical protein GQ43DRAFT_432132 [Delitschia confertaspora ATCC 74209]|uniref:Uncharacterized protein n=1 Tax=Delitschia confertaspora ATCC 74209 TaxID=1513339 RepID=A0A9P4MV69_9PLEO|nr:hypothetical protein GQ43DRAFT_432132 [Delitschia confertaspora ATCC 74209]
MASSEQLPALRTWSSAPASLGPTGEYCSPADIRGMVRPKSPVPSFVPEQPFPFECLPRELRNKVYRELLILNFPMMLIHSRPSWPDLHDPGWKLYPEILRTSKKFHQEASEVLYGENSFYVHYDTPLEDFDNSFWKSHICPEMELGHSIGANAKLIKRVLVYTNMQHMILRRHETLATFAKMGIDLNKLVLWAIKFPDADTLELNAGENRDWLKKVEATKLAKKVIWFPSAETPWAEDTWLVVSKIVL